MDTGISTVVVGAGISGLTLAHGLQRRGMEVTLLEREADGGGVVGSVLEHGFLTENGPNSFLDRHPEVRALLDELGLDAQITPAAPGARKRWVYTRGKLRAVSPSALLFSNLLSWKGRARLLLEPFSRRGTIEDESVSAFARRHVGDEATDVLVDAVQGGIFAGDAELLSVASAFPSLVALEKKHRSLLWGALREGVGRPSATLSLRGGLVTLIKRLEGTLGDRLKKNAHVTELVRVGSRWQVTIDSGDKYESDRVVIALPAWGAAPLVAPLDSVLAEQLGQIRYAPVAVVHLAYPRSVLPPPQGFGFLVPGREKRKVLGVIFTSSLFPDRAPSDQTLVSCVLGGMRSPEVAEKSPEGLQALAEEELSGVLGVRGEPTYARVVKWQRGIPQYEIGHSARWESIQKRLKMLPGLSLLGNGYQGAGLADCIRTSRRLSQNL